MAMSDFLYLPTPLRDSVRHRMTGRYAVVAHTSKGWIGSWRNIVEVSEHAMFVLAGEGKDILIASSQCCDGSTSGTSRLCLLETPFIAQKHEQNPGRWSGRLLLASCRIGRPCPGYILTWFPAHADGSCNTLGGVYPQSDLILTQQLYPNM